MIDDRFARHGAVRVAPGGHHLAHADGTPFFYLADTAWNGALLAGEADWAEYLADRRAKGFTAIQFILTAPWTAALADADGNVAFDKRGEPVEAFFRRMDVRVGAINAAGLLAVPVLAWAAKFGASAKLNPGVVLKSGELSRRLAYLVRRYKARQLMWILAGDGRYGGFRSWKWKAVGRALFGAIPSTGRAPVALHPMGKTWPYPSFSGEGWLDVIGYQTSHADDDATVRWLQHGPMTASTHKPVINLEPCYEGIRNWATGGTFGNVEVRRAMYASLLNAPTAGVAYGAHGVWSWETEAREPVNHAGTGVAKTWREAMGFPGSLDVQRIGALFTSIDWWRLRPAIDWLKGQAEDPQRFVSVGAYDSVGLAYLPRGGRVQFVPAKVEKLGGEWFDPRTGERRPAEIDGGQTTAPTEDDWVLLLH